MTQSRILDSNLIVRHLVQDHPAQSAAAGKLFESCDRGEVNLIVLSAVLAECVFVLSSFYEFGRAEISETLAQLVSSPGVECDRVEVHLDALKRYRATNLHFVDCLLASMSISRAIPVASFDKGLAKQPGIEIRI